MNLWLHEDGVVGRFAGENVIGLEYPLNSSIEHLAGGAAPLVAAILDTSRTGMPAPAKMFVGPAYGTGPITNQRNLTVPVSPGVSWRSTSSLNSGEPNKRDVDDDGDRLTDEDELDGLDNDRDGRIDEDYRAISEQDYYWGFTDSGLVFSDISTHHSLGIKVWQRSYAWARDVREPILPVEIAVINVGSDSLRNVFLGYEAATGVGPVGSPGFVFRNYAGYWPEIRTAFVHNAIDRGSTPVGITVLKTPFPLMDDNYTYRWLISILGSGSDADAYDLLSGDAFPGEPSLKPDQDPDSPGPITLLFSFGPVEEFFPGDTLSYAIAFIGGSVLNFGPDNLYDNARKAQTLYARDYHPPVVLPAPELEMTTGPGMVTLNWGPTGADDDPRNVWDTRSQLASLYPPDHWRRQNPPAGVSTGGRPFEGFRLYRSEDPAGLPNTFTMVQQWDMVDSIGPRYEYDVGIETTFTDNNLVTAKNYWYSLTSFGIPDLYLIDYLDWDETVKQETLTTRSAETSVLASREKLKLSFAPSTSLNEVLVVPNPYRVDESYTLESGGWEGRARSWSEEKRLLKFIHLPPSCTIRIFSLTGDIVTTIVHNDPVKGEADWNLLSESGRAIASGVYVFSVESDLGTQVGKFVIIR